MIVFLFLFILSSFISIAAAKTAPEDIPAGIPSHFASILENLSADELLIERVLSIILRSRISGINPAPIP